VIRARRAGQERGASRTLRDAADDQHLSEFATGKSIDVTGGVLTD
jgi:hypothetical protein